MVIATSATHKSFLASTTHLIYLALQHSGQCGMFALFSSKQIHNDIINWSHRNRKKYCLSPEELRLNETICTRLLKLSLQDRLKCCREARQKFFSES